MSVVCKFCFFEGEIAFLVLYHSFFSFMNKKQKSSGQLILCSVKSLPKKPPKNTTLNKQTKQYKYEGKKQQPTNHARTIAYF